MTKNKLSELQTELFGEMRRKNSRNYSWRKSIFECQKLIFLIKIQQGL